MSDSSDLKLLQRRKTLLTIDRDELESKILSVNKRIENVNKEISALTARDMIVSEHAILRYLERVVKVDVEEVKRRVLTDDLKGRILDDGLYPNPEGFRLVVRDGVIVTILCDE